MSENNPFIDYNLAQNTYASFDAVSLKQHIIDRLNTNAIFKDQNFDGSNISSVIDIVAYSYHVLLFYLNQTSSEVTFNQATIYENMNKIVSLLGYKPVGRQTALVTFNITATPDLTPALYTLKRFGSLNVSGVNYTYIDDIVFEKTLTSEEKVVISNDVLYQGSLVEYPSYTATGEAYETVIISYENFVDNDTARFVSDNTVRVFVKEVTTNTWYEWVETNSLYDNEGSARVYEKRVNEYGRFELKFGNNVSGKKLIERDQVAVYFIYSDGANHDISSGDLGRNTRITQYSSVQFNEISNNIYNGVNVINETEKRYLTLNNDNKSTPVTEEESVTDMRKNVPLFVGSQNRAVTISDYEFYLTKNFNAILASNSVINNTEFVDSVIGYYYGIGLKSPNEDTNVLLNQVTFMTSSNFANVYVYCVPKLGGVKEDNTPIFLSQSQKQVIVNELNKIKMLTQTIVPMDPVYQTFDLGVALPEEVPNLAIKDETVLTVVREKNSRQSKEKLKQDVNNIITSYFNLKNTKLGQVVSLLEISNQILALPGIKSILTQRVVNSEVVREISGISFLQWNPIYPTQDITTTTQDVSLYKFQYPYLYDSANFYNKITVQDE